MNRTEAASICQNLGWHKPRFLITYIYVDMMYKLIAYLLYIKHLFKWKYVYAVIQQYNEDREGRYSSVGIATRYGLDGPGIESRWMGDFPHLSRPAMGPTQPHIKWVPGLLRAKAAGHGVDYPQPFKVDVKERVELYLYSTAGSSWSVLGDLNFCNKGRLYTIKLHSK
jgi:hypothetical protein